MSVPYHTISRYARSVPLPFPSGRGFSGLPFRRGVFSQEGKTGMRRESGRLGMGEHGESGLFALPIIVAEKDDNGQ
jgi:hypothetical protein